MDKISGFKTPSGLTNPRISNTFKKDACMVALICKLTYQLVTGPLEQAVELGWGG